MQGLCNVGFTLVYHKAVEEEFWVGRTVTMTLRPGVCNANNTLEHPSIEWTTMGGGKVKTIETVAIGLLDIDAVSVSNLLGKGVNAGGGDNSLDDDAVADSWCTALTGSCTHEELDCFFTITSNDGEVHLFEALSPQESQRIVNGIRNVAARLCTLLVAGDPIVVTEFYDTASFADTSAKEEEENRALSTDEVMLRLSHAILEECGV